MSWSFGRIFRVTDLSFLVLSSLSGGSSRYVAGGFKNVMVLGTEWFFDNVVHHSFWTVFLPMEAKYSMETKRSYFSFIKETLWEFGCLVPFRCAFSITFRWGTPLWWISGTPPPCEWARRFEPTNPTSLGAFWAVSEAQRDAHVQAKQPGDVQVFSDEVCKSDLILSFW